MRCMRDVLFVGLTVGFFAVAAAFVRGCARIVGPDQAPASGTPVADPDPAEVAP